MYTAFYGFRERPFTIISDPGFLYMSPRHRMAYTYLEYGLMDAVGFILLTGEVGAGKTTLIKHLLKRIPGDVEVAVIFNTNVSAQELLELILDEFELVPRGEGKSKYLDALNAYLIEKHAVGRRVLVIVDEAQNLSREALEEVRMLSNLQTDKASLLQILLSGQPGLRQRLKDPALTQVSQRIAVSYHLGPLDREEVGKYVSHRLKAAGGTNEGLFTPEAVDKVFEWSGGVPRSINILCDAALVYGYADELSVIDGKVVDAVIRDRADTGAVTAGGKTPVAPGQEDPGAGEGLAERIHRLEQEVVRLRTLMEWQVTELENKATSYKDTLVERLEQRLSAERTRCDKLLVQYNRLKDRVINKRSTPQKPTTPPPAEQPRDDRDDPRTAFRIHKPKGAPGVDAETDSGWRERIRNWFAR